MSAIDPFSVSVVIPTYNRADLIGATLDSVLAQTVPPAEVVVVDDGSTDGTEQVVRQYGDRVRYLRMANSGVCAARNLGMRSTQSPWIALCDSDDVWVPHKLERQLEIHRRHPELEYSFTNFVTIDSAGKQFGLVKFDTAPVEFWQHTELLEGGVWTCTANWAHRILLFQPVFPSTVLFRRTLLDRVGFCNEELSRTPSEDLEFALRCLRNTRAAALSEPLVRIRKHTSNKSGNKLRMLCGQVKILTHVLQHHKLDAAERQEVERQIRLRNRMAADEAFATLQLPVLREIAHDEPALLLNGRLSLKYAVTLLPGKLGNRLASALVKRRGPAVTEAGQ